MKLPLLSTAALALLFSGCSSTRMDATADAVGNTIAHPVNALVNSTAPLPQDHQYTYWKPVPGTNLFEPYTADHPLSPKEQQDLGILPAPAPTPAATETPPAK